MNDQQRILEALRRARKRYQDRLAIHRLGLFGSYASGTARQDSDVDVLVDFENVTFDNFMDLKLYLEDQLGKKVDLVMSRNIKPRLRENVLGGVIDA